MAVWAGWQGWKYNPPSSSTGAQSDNGRALTVVVGEREGKVVALVHRGGGGGADGVHGGYVRAHRPTPPNNTTIRHRGVLTE